MKFCWTTINVLNMADSLKFYQEIVGLTLRRRFPAGPGTEIAFGQIFLCHRSQRP